MESPPAQPQSVSRPAREALLIVDDEATIRQVMQAMLEDRGYRVASASNRRETVRELQSGPVRAVLLDLTLPGCTPDDMVAAIRETAPGVPVILASGRTESELRDHAARLSCAGFVRKPFSADDLFQAVRTALEDPG